MRIASIVLCVLSAGLAEAADLPLFFDSGSNFSGTIVRHRMQANPNFEAQASRQGQPITVRMVTMADKAVVLVTRSVNGDKTFVSTFQSKSDQILFDRAKTVLAEKAKLFDLAARYNDPGFRADVYEAREYVNRDWIVALPLLIDGPPNAALRTHLATVVLHALDNDTIQGELLVHAAGNRISEVLWFDLTREGASRAPAAEPVPAAPARPNGVAPLPPTPAPSTPAPPVPDPPVPARVSMSAASRPQRK